MKAIFTFTFLVTYISSIGQFAIINDKDSFVNVRASPERNSNVLDRLSNGTLIYCFETAGNWINIDYENKRKIVNGYIYKDRCIPVSSFPSFRVTKKLTAAIVLKKDSIEITISKSKFDKTKHKFTYFKNYPDQIQLIDHQQYWGKDGELPTTQFSSIAIKIGQKIITLPKSALQNLYEPSLYTAEANYDTINDVLYIQTMNSDGAGSYLVIWKIEKGVYTNRFIVYGF